METALVPHLVFANHLFGFIYSKTTPWAATFFGLLSLKSTNPEGKLEKKTNRKSSSKLSTKMHALNAKIDELKNITDEMSVPGANFVKEPHFKEYDSN